MQKALILGTAILLTACLPPQEPGTPVPRPLTQERPEPVEPDVMPESATGMLMTGSGDVLPERLLPNGMLEIGDRDAPVSLVLFTEHHCRYCGDFLRDHWEWLSDEYIGTGLVRLGVVTVPLKKYENSRALAGALRCAAAQDKGWVLHTLLLGDPAALAAHIKTAKLDAKAMDTCMKSGETERTLAEQAAWARSLDVSLVPTIYLNGEKMTGLPYAADLRGAIDRVIAEQSGN